MAGILLLPACSAAGQPSPFASGSPTPVLGVELLNFAFDPSEHEVRVGDEVRIIALNRTDLPHELFIGSPAEQDVHHALHANAAPEQQGDLDTGVQGIYVPAGGSAQFTYRFDRAGEVLMGCHLVGHFEAGMVGVIHVTAAP